MRSVIKPARLQRGDQVAVVSPASPCPPEELNKGIQVLADLSLRVTVMAAPEGAGESPGYLAGADQSRASLLERALADPEFKAVFCARGGYGSSRLLSHLNYDQLRQHPCILVGFSDLTALLLACWHRADLVCFHGPTVASLEAAAAESVVSLWQALSAAEPLEINPGSSRCLRPGKATGVVIGGNLTMMAHLVGSDFLPPLAGTILFCEDRGEAGYRLDRLLTQLRHAGCLQRLAGLIVGDFIDCGDPEFVDSLILERCRGTAFPIVAGYPVGHGSVNLTLPIGIPATLDADSGSLIYREVATVP